MDNMRPETGKIIAIVQARMGSTRLPEKAMRDIEGHPMLWHVCERLKRSEFIDDIVIATTLGRKDDEIEAACADWGVCVYRGDEKDVLDRYFQAALQYNAGVIVRITSDCPLIDPEVSDTVISAYLEDADGYDGASNVMKRTYPRGLDTEVIPLRTLRKVWERADNEHHREHVTAYIYENPGAFKIREVTGDRALSHLRWTVDEEADLKFVREIYRRLYMKKKVFSMEDVLRVIKEEPCLAEINAGVKQKPVSG